MSKGRGGRAAGGRAGSREGGKVKKFSKPPRRLEVRSNTLEVCKKALVSTLSSGRQNGPVLATEASPLPRMRPDATYTLDKSSLNVKLRVKRPRALQPMSWES